MDVVLGLRQCQNQHWLYLKEQYWVAPMGQEEPMWVAPISFDV